MRDKLITHVDFGNNHGKVHRLNEPVRELIHANGQKLACGRTFHTAPFCAGWNDYPESRSSFCSRCR